jgi:hypothetical protein
MTDAVDTGRRRHSRRRRRRETTAPVPCYKPSIPRRSFDRSGDSREGCARRESTHVLYSERRTPNSSRVACVGKLSFDAQWGAGVEWNSWSGQTEVED